MTSSLSLILQLPSCEGQPSSSSVGQPVSCDPGQLLVIPTQADQIMFTAPFADPAAVTAVDYSCGCFDAAERGVAGRTATTELASVCWPPVELGAEVVCGEGDSPTKRSTRPAVAALNRRCSYEEVVHSDMEQEPLAPGTPELLQSTILTFAQCLQCVTQCAVTLRDVLEDRGRSGLVGVTSQHSVSTNCVCRKAKAIVEKLEKLELRFGKVSANPDRSNFEKLWLALLQMKETLRMNVSIQVS